MNLRTVSKAIAGAVATSVGAVGTTVVAVPDGIEMPWWGYVLVGLINAGIGFLVVYLAPRNAPSPR